MKISNEAKLAAAMNKQLMFEADAIKMGEPTRQILFRRGDRTVICSTRDATAVRLISRYAETVFANQARLAGVEKEKILRVIRSV